MPLKTKGSTLLRPTHQTWHKHRHRQHIDIEIPHGLRDHVIVPDTIKIMFNLEIESIDKARSVANNVGRALVKKEGAHNWFKRD